MSREQKTTVDNNQPTFSNPVECSDYSNSACSQNWEARHQHPSMAACNSDDYAEDFPSLQSARAGGKKRPTQQEVGRKKLDHKDQGGHMALFVARSLQGRPTLDEAEAGRILEHIEALWFDRSTKDKSHVSAQLRDYFTNAENPFQLLIYLTEKSRDFHVAKTTTLAYNIVKEFHSWCKIRKHSSEDVKLLLTPQIRSHALNMCTRYHTTMFNLILQTFALRHPGNDYMLPEVKKYLAKQKYKEAAVCAGGLGLQDHFTIEEIALPLILQDKVNLIETYVQGNPTQQKLVVQLLDKMCDRELKLDQFLGSVDIPNMKREKLQKKTLSKLAARLMKLYDIPPENCPNISNARAFGALKYLLYRRYIECSMGSGSWEEMVMNAIGDSDNLKEQLVEQLMCYNELTAAAKWADFYKLPDDRLPTTVLEERRRLAQAPAPITDTHEEDWDAETISAEEMSSIYYKLKLSLDQITMIDTKEGFFRCLSTLAKPNTVIGIDSEWKPSFGTTVQKVGLIQLAVLDHVYLLDIPSLTQQLTPQDWHLLSTEIFCNKGTLKLGYGLDSDLKMLVKTLPFLKEGLTQMNRTVDLEKLALKVIDKVINLLPDTVGDSDEEECKEDDDSGVNITFSKPPERGLSELVRQCLGKPLNKSEQMSDWERRPLRQPQVIYAALDAYVLLEVYQVMTDTARRENMQINLEPPISMKWCKDSKRDKQKMKAKGIKVPQKLPPHKQSSNMGDGVNLSMSRTLNQEPVSRSEMTPGQLRVVVDTMLQGLGRHLRSCGVDVHIVENHQEHEDTIEICLREGRIILTKGLPYSMIRANVGEDMCYHVVAEGVRDQVVEVLEHFKVKVTEGDIFSRCQVCNGGTYIQIPTGDMRVLWQRKMDLMATSPMTRLLSVISKSSEPSMRGDAPQAVAGAPSNGGDSSKTQNREPVLVDDQSVRYFMEHYGINLSTVVIENSKSPLQVDTVPEGVLDQVDMFYCCARCGKTFWEGKHFKQVCEQFSHVLSPSQENVDGESGYLAAYKKDQGNC